MINKAILSPNEKRAIELLKKKLMSRFNIIEMKLYGSKARGDHTPESDIDIMIELEERDYKLESDIFSVIYDINLENDVFITPLFMSRRQIVEGPLSESPLYKSIKREGLSL
ncbi:MAG: hypothetical protein A2W19_14375 [Spirochaetes bacterium RBG_16_49_21]|nr:MAG: hypothetical protein A2W19_14375 [Spirochaetes bacterium RBG_16_49_21]